MLEHGEDAEVGDPEGKRPVDEATDEALLELFGNSDSIPSYCAFIASQMSWL